MAKIEQDLLCTESSNTNPSKKSRLSFSAFRNISRQKWQSIPDMANASSFKTGSCVRLFQADKRALIVTNWPHWQ